jgi:hypothetical protein
MTEHELASKKHIESLTKADWQPLFDLIPEMERAESFGTWEGGGTDENGVINLPYPLEDAVVHSFLELVYKMGIIVSFNWGAWDEGREMANTENFDFDTVDVFTKCKIITAIARNDRFCVGALLDAFESGIILVLLKSIQRQVG